MQRRSFLKTASLAAFAPMAAGTAWCAPKAPRIAFGGIGIECSTYSRIRARMEDFSILTDGVLTSSERFAFLKRYPIPFQPVLVASAVPGGPVAMETYQAIKAGYLSRLKTLLPLDGLFLPMHGAMFVDGMEDAEGDWMEATRKLVGQDCLMSASYDLHGNVSQRVVDNIDMFSAFRTAPHIDREETMIRACDMLVQSLQQNLRPTIVWAPVPVLMPGERSSTEWEPGKRLWAPLATLNNQPGILDVSMLVGYVWADEPRSTASVVITGVAPAKQKEIATGLAQKYWDARKEFQFGTETCTVDECVVRAMQAKTQPAILADSGDNPTGGGNSDRAEVLEVLLRKKATNVVFAGITDRPAADACYLAGIGATIPLSIGATLDPKGSRPVKANATVKFLLPVKDPLLREAVVQIEGVTLVLSARRRPYHDILDFTRLGLEPKSFKIIVVKSGYLSPELKPLANPSLMALSDGAINQDIVHLPANRLRKPTYPFVPDLQFKPVVYTSARSKG
ncbi:M81 family metallopeptidase [Terriglobus saanensis]|uniref:Microcystin LR degradation protein MlrC-like protein n=1 Tax=Terriglobus saanensis (strain ATCC BAA-1853 / DSM 23119 / SP1PR4) TaxID=401053 RepID=E8V354_TERSS|nr:M81 family metallopeptidase [Terriglobus saanensis]ADV81329.1 Microcystin LR degradation protein MlrC-like protein [Terriglobus saanensis SP1PR4]